MMKLKNKSPKLSKSKIYKFCLIKAYFDKGLGLTSYVKYFIALFGIASQDVSKTLWITFFYAVFCFILGYAWYKYNFIEQEIEVGNKFNLFVKEMRNLSGAIVK